MARREDRTGMNADRPGTVVRNMPMHDQILPRLRKDIVENRWKSGERLPEPQLCKEFGISPTPLRQALKTLESEGLVSSIPHVGAVLTDPDAAEVGETMEILIGLEQLAAIRVAQSRQPVVLLEIKESYREMQRAAKQSAAKLYTTSIMTSIAASCAAPAINRWPTCMARKSCGTFTASAIAPP